MTVDYLLGILTLPALAVAVFAVALCREAAGHVWAMALQYGPWRPVWLGTARRAGQLLARGEARGFSGRQWGTVRTMRKHARTAATFGRWPLILWPPFLYVAVVAWVLGRER